MRAVVEMWTIYDSPDDHSGSIVARRFMIRPGSPEPQADKGPPLFAESIDVMRWRLQSEFGMSVPIPWDENDAPSIVETWI